MYDAVAHAYDNTASDSGTAGDYRARYYDPATGRFLSEDPLGFWGDDVNFYRYVGNSPISWIDPAGLGRLPADPTGLGSDWQHDPSHRDPNGSRWRNPDGDYLDFNKGRPGLDGNRGKDHWHHNGGEDHLYPGDEVPVDTGCPSGNPEADPDEIPLIDPLAKWINKKLNYPFTGPFWDKVRDFQRDFERGPQCPTCVAPLPPPVFPPIPVLP